MHRPPLQVTANVADVIPHTVKSTLISEDPAAEFHVDSKKIVALSSKIHAR